MVSMSSLLAALDETQKHAYYLQCADLVLAHYDLGPLTPHFVQHNAGIVFRLDDAGLANAAIDWSGSANDYWHAIIQAALNNGQLAALLVIVREEYPDNRELAGALGELLR